jgi:hypothetical protein
MRPTRELGRAALERSSIWSCTGWGLPSFPGHPGNWCALTAPFHPYPASTAGRFTFCCTFLHVTVTPCYGAPCPVVFGLSSGNTLSQRSSGRLQPVAARAILSVVSAPPKSANLVEIKSREKFNRRPMGDIPRIHFSPNADIYPPSAGRANWPFMDGHLIYFRSYPNTEFYYRRGTISSCQTAAAHCRSGEGYSCGSPYRLNCAQGPTPCHPDTFFLL